MSWPEEKSMTEDVKKLEKQSTLNKMSTFEKLFWLTIAVLASITIILVVMAKINAPVYLDSPVNNKENINNIKKTEEVDYKSILSQLGSKVLLNLDKAKPILDNDILNLTQLTNEKVDTEIDAVFSNVIQNNLDNFLDFHYSVMGEYIEIGSMAFNNIESSIHERLLGNNFSNEISQATKKLDEQYQLLAAQHLQLMNSLALKETNLNLHPDIKIMVDDVIEQNISIQKTKFGALIVISLVPKIISIVSVTLASKVVAKIASKAVAKSAAKMASASAGLTAGVACGPFVWVCAPAFGTIAWFGTDAVIVNVDEYFHRAEFKAHIVGVLTEQRDELKTSLKKSYAKALEELSQQSKEQYLKINALKDKPLKDSVFSSEK